MPVLALVLVVTAGCGAAARSEGSLACPAIGSVPGIGVDIRPRSGQTIGGATIDACWNGTCRTWPVQLAPSTAPASQTCTGTAPDDSCSAQPGETGGETGLVVIPDLPAGPVRVTVTVTDLHGAEIARVERLTTAQLMYPAGPECGGASPQVHLVVTP